MYRYPDRDILVSIDTECHSIENIDTGSSQLIGCLGVRAYVQVYVFDGYAGWEPESRVSVRVLCGRAYHALFMHNMLIRPTSEELKTFRPDFTIYNAGWLENAVLG